MSRVAKNPVIVPGDVDVAMTANEISIKGPLGVLKHHLTADITVVREGDSLMCSATMRPSSQMQCQERYVHCWPIWFRASVRVLSAS